MNKGGTVTPIGAAIKIHMVHAEHSSSADLLSLKPESAGPRYVGAGAAVGYVIELENGFKIYFTGDTDVFGDMALVNRFYRPEYSTVIVGRSRWIPSTLPAMRELVQPKQVIPMHYGTCRSSTGHRPNSGPRSAMRRSRCSR
jgi:L-ascorbate metabolism protein UlaG (beta-lactamase superfamily)